MPGGMRGSGERLQTNEGLRSAPAPWNIAAMQIPGASEVESFYRAAVLGLRFLEGRERRGRRFGEVAGAAWKALGGEFELRDRLELLVRDAAATHPLAFSPRLVFGAESLTEDEPFGASFPQPGEGLAKELLREGTRGGELEIGPLLVEAAARWRLAMPDMPAALMEAARKVGASSRVALSGPLGILALAMVAAGRRELDLGDQVLLVSSSAAERQLFGLALLASGGRARACLLEPSAASAEAARSLGFSHLDLVLVGEDADASARGAIATLQRELGA